MTANTSSCVLYSRVSSDQQNNKSQIDDLKSYAKYMKFKVLATFEEKISGTTKANERLAYKELLNFIEANHVDNVLVWELSRLGRNLEDVLNTVGFLTNKQINVYAKKENLNTLNEDKTLNHTAQMILSIMGSVNQYERTVILARNRRGLRYHLKNGGAFSLSPFGYRNVDGKIAVDPEEEITVKEIYKLFTGGMASPSIAKHLNLKNIPTKKNVKWNDVQIRDILHNTMYYGQRIYSFATVSVPPIISKSEYLKAQQIFKENRNLNKDKAIFTNYLSGLVICGECGLGYYQHARRTKKDFAYKCMSNRLVTTGQLEKNCGNNGIGINLLNSMVYNALFTILIKFSNKDDFEKHLKTLTKNVNIELKNTRNEINILKNEINKSTNKMTRLTELVISNVVSESDYLTQKQVIESGLETNTNRLNQLLINESNLLHTKSEETFISGLKKHLSQIQSNGLKEITDYYEMGIELYKNLIKTFIKSVIVKKCSIADFTSLETMIPETHHKRISKVVVDTLFGDYIFYTVTGFNMYSFQLLNNNLFKIEVIKEVSQ